MAYEVIIMERYKGSPIARTTQINFTTSMSCNSIEETGRILYNSLKSVREKYEVLREWSEQHDEKLSYKILFTRNGKNGRLIRSYEVVKIKKAHKIKFDDLI